MKEQVRALARLIFRVRPLRRPGLRSDPGSGSSFLAGIAFGGHRPTRTKGTEYGIY
jgi:hypothetical protein